MLFVGRELGVADAAHEPDVLADAELLDQLLGATAGRRAPQELVFLEQMGGLVSLLVWLAFGAIAVPIMLARFDALIVLYAVLSLTVVRMVPVAIAIAIAPITAWVR